MANKHTFRACAIDLRQQTFCKRERKRKTTTLCPKKTAEKPKQKHVKNLNKHKEHVSLHFFRVIHTGPIH